MTDGGAINESRSDQRKDDQLPCSIHRVARRALSAEERVGQQIQHNARAEIEGAVGPDDGD
jgi:hypothetical protein